MTLECDTNTPPIFKTWEILKKPKERKKSVIDDKCSVKRMGKDCCLLRNEKCNGTKFVVFGAWRRVEVNTDNAVGKMTIGRSCMGFGIQIRELVV